MMGEWRSKYPTHSGVGKFNSHLSFVKILQNLMEHKIFYMMMIGQDCAPVKSPKPLFWF